LQLTGRGNFPVISSAGEASEGSLTSRITLLGHLLELLYHLIPLQTFQKRFKQSKVIIDSFLLEVYEGRYKLILETQFVSEETWAVECFFSQHISWKPFHENLHFFLFSLQGLLLL
jgi:hypothetical protein